MISVTLQEAKAKLNQLVDAAQAGEDVVLMRGSRIVARLQPLSETDIELASHLTDAQAEKFWAEIESSPSKKLNTPQEAVNYLKRRQSS